MARPPNKKAKSPVHINYDSDDDAGGDTPVKETPGPIKGHGWEVPVELIPVLLGGALFYFLQMQFYPQSVGYFGKCGFIIHVATCIAVATFIVWKANKQIRK